MGGLGEPARGWQSRQAWELVWGRVGARNKETYCAGEARRAGDRLESAEGVCVVLGSRPHGAKGSKSYRLAGSASPIPGHQADLLGVVGSAQQKTAGTSTCSASRHTLQLQWHPVLSQPFHPEGSLGWGYRGQDPQREGALLLLLGREVPQLCGFPA